MLALHEEMEVRLTQKLSAIDGLVNERRGIVKKIVLDPADEAKVQDGYHLPHLQYMPKGVWVHFPKLKTAPLQDHVRQSMPDHLYKDLEAFRDSLVYVQLESAEFSAECHLPDGSYESVHVTR